MPKNCWILAAIAWLWLGAAGHCLATTNAPTPLPVSATPHSALRTPHSTSSTYSVKVWDTEDGLPQSAVLALTQTRDGYLWVGTYDGLARFDGTRFTTFNEANTPELTSSRIFKLFEDSRGDLWIGTESAGVFVVQNGKLKSVDIGRGKEGRLMAICEDAKGAIWFYTANGRLGRYQDNHGDLWNADTDVPRRCRALAVDGDLLWVGNDRSLSALGAVPSGAAVGLPVVHQPPIQQLDYLLSSQRGGYWRLANGRIQKCHATRVDDLCAYPWTNTVTVFAACEDLEGNLIVGTYGDGVYWFDAAGKFTHLASKLSHGLISSLTVDREGCLWVGTDGGGLNRVKRQAFHLLPNSTNSTVQSVCEDAHGGLWIGYSGERIDHLTPNGFQQYPNVQNELTGPPNYYVRSLFLDCDQQLWAGTYMGGLLQFREGRFQAAPNWQSLPQEAQNVSVIYQDRSHRLWVGTQAGLALRQAHGWQLQTNQLPATAVRALAEDHAGNLWVGFEGSGLHRLQAGQVTRFGKAEGLPSENISALYVDEDDVLWVGTFSGLARWQNGKCTSYAGQGGLVTRSIGYLLEDNQGFLWIGSNGGLLRVRKQDLNDFAVGRLNSVTVRSFGKADGLPTRECTQGSQPAACRTRDGRLWFPTLKGLVSIHPAELQPNTNPPPVMIESVLVDGRVQGATNALRAAPLQAITIPPGKRTLEIHFTALNLSAPEEVRFQYRLEGLETDWISSTARFVRYPNLPPKKYHFQVKACNEDGVWNEIGSSLAITVLPPFWQTRWFLTTATLCLLGMIIGSVHYVSTQKLQRELALMRQHEALEKERARIARDLHDQLGANLTQVALLGEMAETDKELPQEVESHARQISQTARDTTRALDEIVWTVNPSNDTLDGLINYICKYAQEYLALAELRYRMEVPAQLPGLPISPEVRHNVFLAAKETINNIVKHAGATSAWLRLDLQPQRFTLEIEDNGRGLTSADEKKGRNGLRNMRKRMEDIGGEFAVGPGAEGGTRVRLTAPIKAS